MTDPPKKSSGLKQPRFKYDILLQSLTPTPVQTLSDEDSFNILGPGEYEVQKMTVRGFALKDESDDSFLKSIYLINDGEATVCFLGHMSEPALDPKIMEALGEIDILIIPGGGEPFLPQEEAVKLTHQLEPSIVIPGAFNVPALERKAAPVKGFLQEMGAQTKPIEKATIKKRDLNPEETKVVVLEPVTS